MPDATTHRCRYLLRWTKEHRRMVYCNHDVLRKNIMLEPRELLGPCPEDCPDFEARWPLESAPVDDEGKSG
jgi:hypothetical protein